MRGGGRPKDPPQLAAPAPLRAAERGDPALARQGREDRTVGASSAGHSAGACSHTNPCAHKHRQTTRHTGQCMACTPYRSTYAVLRLTGTRINAAQTCSCTHTYTQACAHRCESWDGEHACRPVRDHGPAHLSTHVQRGGRMSQWLLMPTATLASPTHTCTPTHAHTSSTTWEDPDTEQLCKHADAPTGCVCHLWPWCLLLGPCPSTPGCRHSGLPKSL